MLSMRTVALATRNLGAFAEAARRVWNILRALFQEVVGFIFLVLGGWGALWLFRTSRRFDGDGETLFKMAMVGVFVLMMTGFGISSFRNARRISRSK
jgi:hypothetical protein